jgi:hypothetical protein
MPRHFSTIIADAEASFTCANYKTELWMPDFEDEIDAPFQPQILAAYQIFLKMFGESKKLWIHLAAEMQAGKTGVVTTLIRLMLNVHNRHRLNGHPDRIFVATGMNDNAWIKQTRERLPEKIRKNVYHNGSLQRLEARLRALRGEGNLKNVLVVLDESHIASKGANKPAKHIFSVLQELCPIEQWAENNIRIMTISATDPATVIDIAEFREYADSVVLHTTEEYQSVEKLKNAARISDTFPINSLESCRKLTDKIRMTFADEPLYHFIRPGPKDHSKMQGWLETLVPGCNVLYIDSKENKRRADDTSTISSDMLDVNDILETAPERHTFIVLKNMFYASKTLNDTHVGAFYDRVSAQDATNLQSLLGRACGYGKSTRTIVITSMQTVENYLKIWRDLKPREPLTFDTPVRRLDGKMPCVKATAAAGGAKLESTATHANPLRSAAQAAAAAPSRKKTVADASLIHSHGWTEFATEAEAKDYIKSIGCKPRKIKRNEAGFAMSSFNSGKCRVGDMNQIALLKSKTITTGLPGGWSEVVSGAKTSRLFAAYSDTSDLTTERCFVRWWQRK